MLQITIPEKDMFNEKTSEFITSKRQVIQLEHSLISLSKWESKWKKPFLSLTNRTREETLDYIRCMTITQGVEPVQYEALGIKEMQEIEEYISDPHTATTIHDRRNQSHRRNETITSELIYYWMIDCGIPFECEKWHLNRLLTLIRVCSIKQLPQKQMSQLGIFAQNRELNAARRKALNTRG